MPHAALRCDITEYEHAMIYILAYGAADGHILPRRRDVISPCRHIRLRQRRDAERQRHC